MATTPQGDDADVRKAVMEALARSVARRQMAVAQQPTPLRKPKRMSGAQSLATLVKPGVLR